MKYITFENLETTKIEMVLFPDTIDHDCMAEGVQRLKNQTHGNWRREHRFAISAGFVDMMNLTCHGKSVTLNLESQEGDTELLRNQF